MDVIVRSFAQKLSERLLVPVIVENKPSANGNVGSAGVANGPADGYTLLLGTSSTIAINPHLIALIDEKWRSSPPSTINR